jgi:hypothetical protein
MRDGTIQFSQHYLCRRLELELGVVKAIDAFMSDAPDCFTDGMNILRALAGRIGPLDRQTGKTYPMGVGIPVDESGTVAISTSKMTENGPVCM